MNESALVTGRHRRHVIVETAGGDRLRCIVRGRQLKPLVGDDVSIEVLGDGTAVVTAIDARRTALSRIDARGRPEGVAANVTQLVIVTAGQPAPDWLLVDRYLAAAELAGFAALLVWNKCDLASPPHAGRLPVYRAIGYTVIETSASDGRGMDTLRAALAGQRSVLVGQSGVGKSSLMNRLVGEQAQLVGELSDRRALGRHTTTSVVLYRLAGGGELIDSPGVRHYAPHLAAPERLAWAYREFRSYLDACRFDDCRHEAEPGCAVKAAVESGAIARDRHASFLGLRRALSDLAR